MATTTVAVRELDATGFAPYGRVVEVPREDPDAAGGGWKWWGETALLPGDAGSYGIGYLELRPAEPEFDWAERHMSSVELIVPLGGPCLVYAGPPEHPDEPARAPDRHRFEVFRLDSGRAVILHPGVWHGAPLALGAPVSALVLLREGTGARDTTVVRWPEPVRIQA